MREPEGWVKYPVFVPGEAEPRCSERVSLIVRAVQMLDQGEIAIAGVNVVAGVAGLERWAAALRDGRIFDRADSARLETVVAATLEMIWMLRPTRQTAALYLYSQSAHHEGEVRTLLRKVAGLFLDVAQPLAFELEEALTKTPKIRDEPEHEVSHLEVTRRHLRDPQARAAGTALISQIADKEREALESFREIIARSNP